MNATDILKYGQQTVQQTLSGFPASAWEQPGACGEWSVKDIIAHLASYEQVLVDILNSFTKQVATPALDRFIELGGQFNDYEVRQRKEKTMEEVLQELNEAHSSTMSFIAAIPVETLRQAGTLPWYGMAYSLDDVIVYMYYGHKREHSAQIAAFQDRLG
ncbi:MAG: DinB family protein [Ktedonobacteraceae bacterium]|nr:DinB family protein [Ktedonobacteraceae bacterium]